MKRDYPRLKPKSKKYNMNTKQMSLFSVKTPIHIPHNEIWYEVKINMPERSRLTPSYILRAISNSKQSVGRRTNREWWKQNVMTGFYLTNLNTSGLQIIMYLKVKKELHLLDFRTRIKKICGLASQLNVVRVNELYLPQQLITLHHIKDGYQEVLNLALNGAVD
jgi:hypothetical protein